MYYNTTNLAGAELQEARSGAENQDAVVLKIFQRKEAGLTASEAWRMARQRWPLTSVRRSINTLTNIGKLEKTAVKRVGYYGKKEYVWRIV